MKNIFLNTFQIIFNIYSKIPLSHCRTKLGDTKYKKGSYNLRNIKLYKARKDSKPIVIPKRK